MKPKTLYYSPFDKFENCPQNFLWSRGWGTIDLGAGPGKRKPVPEKKSEHHALMGTAVQSVVEKFYNDQLWRLLSPTQLRDRLMELADQSFKLELARSYIDWRKAPPREEMEKLIKDAIRGYMRTLKHHHFLGTYARAEVDLVGYVNKYTPVGGRADLIIRREDTGVSILDGKNSKRYKDGHGGSMTYTNPDQLRWYALCYYLAYKKMPDRLGFVYYRYPYGNPMCDVDGFPVLDEMGTQKIEDGVEWVPFTMDDIKGLGQRAVDATQSMFKEHFEATPTPKTCKFCDYESVCPERQAQIASNRRTPSKKNEVLAADAGLTLFSFGGPGKKGLVG